jgi:carboxylesterase type B
MTVDEKLPSVTLAQGQVVGTRLKDTFPQTVEAFLGVPYALPPVGDLRFRPAVKVASSSDTIDASKYGPAAPGKALLSGGPKLEQSEDCLTANIFRPASTGDVQNLPVAVYIHGGAFNRGAATMHDTASMVAWSEEPFLAVSFGYRIGALGFLPSTLSEKEGLLNLGLRDQIHLLEWVQENIGRFGGDAGNVTLFGLSAGAHSVRITISSITKIIILIKECRSATSCSIAARPLCSTASSSNQALPHLALFGHTMQRSTKTNSKISSRKLNVPQNCLKLRSSLFSVLCQVQQ